MPNHSFAARAAGALAGLAAVGAAIALGVAWENHSLRSKLATAHQQSTGAAAELSRLRAEQTETAASLAAHEDDLASLRREMQALRDAQNDEPAPANRFAPARLFAGNRYLGTAWVQDAAEGEAGSLPTVVLDPAILQATAPAAAPAPSPTPASYGAGYAFVQTYQYPSYLWTSGWVDYCDGPTNHPFAPSFTQPPANPPPTTTPTPPAYASSAATKARGSSLADADRPFRWRTPIPVPTRPSLASASTQVPPMPRRTVPIVAPQVRSDARRAPVSRTAPRATTLPPTPITVQR